MSPGANSWRVTADLGAGPSRLRLRLNPVAATDVCAFVTATTTAAATETATAGETDGMLCRSPTIPLHTSRHSCPAEAGGEGVGQDAAEGAPEGPAEAVVAHQPHRSHSQARVGRAARLDTGRPPARTKTVTLPPGGPPEGRRAGSD